MQLQITNLVKTYKGRVTALNDVSCSLGKGIIAVIGPSAAGKTTFLKMLAGVEEPTAGQIYFDGLELSQNKQAFRLMMGYLPQKFGFYSNSTGEAMLHYIAALKGINDHKMRQYRVDEAMDLTNLKEARKERIGEYSFGMKRRLGIAQALLGKPRILILDEPMEGLDPQESIRLGGIITEMADQSLIVIATHSLHNIEFGCSTLLILRQGGMLYNGSPAELVSRADGSIWQVEVGLQQIEQLKATFKIVGVQQQDGYALVRILSSSKPFETAIAVKAGLEEGYMALMDAAEAQI